MTRVLAVIRRIALAGSIALILGAIVFSTSIQEMFKMAMTPTSFKNIFCIFMLLAPIVYIIFNLISAVYIRHHGQFAASHREHPFIVTVFKALGSDLVSPFKNLAGFFTALFNKYPDFIPEEMAKSSRGVSIRRFIGMIILIIFCLAGLISLM